MKLQSISIKGFQSHKDTTLKFHSRFNVITGPTNVGKSAIVRALYKTLFDIPSGSRFINHSTKEAVITIEVGKRTITRSINKKGSGYYEVDGTKFQGFGRVVPQEVLDAHQCFFTTVDRKKLALNFSKQIGGSLFLVDDTPAFRAKVLGLVTGSDVIDRALVVGRQNYRHHKGEKTYLKESLQSIKREIGELPDDKDFRSRLEKAQNELMLCGASITTYKSTLTLSARRKEVVDRMQQLQKVVGQIDHSKFIASLEKVEDRLEGLSHLQELIDQKQMVEKRMDDLKDAIRRVQSKEGEIKSEVKKVVSKLKNCPLCNTKLTMTHLKKFMNFIT